MIFKIYLTVIFLFLAIYSYVYFSNFIIPLIESIQGEKVVFDYFGASSNRSRTMSFAMLNIRISVLFVHWQLPYHVLFGRSMSGPLQTESWFSSSTRRRTPEEDSARKRHNRRNCSG